MTTAIALLFAVVVAAQIVETVTGFGATVVALALGVMLVPLEVLVVALVMIGILQSAWLVSRGWRLVAWRPLLTRILPLCAAGLAAGRLFSVSVGGGPLKVLLGVFVVAIAVLELGIMLRGARERSPLPGPAGVALLAVGGFFHGVFASGGPLVVLYASRAIADKGSFRATLSVLWLALNVALAVTYAARGEMAGEPLVLAAWLLPALAAGIAVGEALHRRLNETVFKTVVYSLLLATGVTLLVPGRS